MLKQKCIVAKGANLAQYSDWFAEPAEDTDELELKFKFIQLQCLFYNYSYLRAFYIHTTVAKCQQSDGKKWIPFFIIFSR